MLLGVTGCLPTMPSAFPLDHPENAGNMIHARAPLEMFSRTVTADGWWTHAGAASFREFVNQKCDRVIVTLANYLQVGDENGAHYANFQRFLESFDVPVVIFGLGAQNESTDLNGRSMPPEAIALMRYLGENCGPVSVRGKFTADVFEHFAGVTNTYVTGCPSFFSRPQGLAKLRQNIGGQLSGRPSYAGTAYHVDAETRMLEAAILADTFLIEPVNKFNHRLHLEASRGEADVEIPWYLRPALNSGLLTKDRLLNFYRSNYRLFRDADAWYQFNEENVSYTYGSRFHVNMASILSGRPAVWVTHDSRTEELCEFLHLPRVPMAEATHMHPADFRPLASYEEFFDHVDDLFSNWNGYLRAHGLPETVLQG